MSVDTVECFSTAATGNQRYEKEKKIRNWAD